MLFEQLLAQAPPGVERADVLFGLATVRPADPLTCARLLEEALAEAADDDERSARILGYRALIAFTSVGPGRRFRMRARLSRGPSESATPRCLQWLLRVSGR